MKVILSPAKKMIDASDDFPAVSKSTYLDKTEVLYEWMRSQSFAQLKSLWNCSEKLAKEAYAMLEQDPGSGISAAVHSYSGLAYQHLSASSMTYDELAWLDDHLRILSGYYGILRPNDAVLPYRLEMQAKVHLGQCTSLYEYWSDDLYRALDDRVIVNLASAEYASAIEPYLKESDRYITFVFAEEKGDKLIQKGTYAKAARGEMVRWMAENGVEEPQECKKFTLHYQFTESLSDAKQYVFLKKA